MPMVLLTLTIQDADGDKSSVSVYVDVGIGDTAESIAEDYAHLLWDTIRPLVNGVLVGAQAALKVDFSAWANNTPAVISDVQEKAVFTLRVCGSWRPVRLTLPTVKESIFTGAGAGRLVDPLNSDYSIFAYVLANGVVDGGIGATDSHGADICEVVLGEQYFGRG